MDTQELTERLHQRATEVEVRPAPYADIRVEAERRRRRRGTAVAAAAAAAVVAIVSFGVVLERGTDPAVPPATTPTRAVDLPPAGYRWAGVGPVVVAVPAGWGRNQEKCGTPLQDTVLILGPVCWARVPRPADVDSLTLESGGSLRATDTSRWEHVAVDGTPALRSPVVSDGGVATATLYVPTYDAVLVAASSSRDADAVVTSLLDGATVLREHTTVPNTTSRDYLDRLTELGLEARVVRRDTRRAPGEVIEVQPPAGTLVRLGSTVVVTLDR